MAYKSLLTVVTQLEALETTIASAVALATSYDAHLEVLCFGVEQTQFDYSYLGSTGALVQQVMDIAREKSVKLEAAVRGHLEPQSIRWSLESMAVPIGLLTETVAQRARFCDLMVQPKPYAEGNIPEAEAVIEAALFDAKVPVLVLPDGPMVEIPGKRIVVAWNQSNEAMAAVRAAIPLLKAAELVTIMIVDPVKFGSERSDPGGALSQLLARHGVKAEVTVLAKTLPRFCDMLNRHARDRSADMVVMGAYGHSRLRESILGGATRGMLEQAEIPVFMAH
jgi:nucleotide-binding universal stress UspA family protein